MALVYPTGDFKLRFQTYVDINYFYRFDYTIIVAPLKILGDFFLNTQYLLLNWTIFLVFVIVLRDTGTEFCWILKFPY